MKRGDLDPDARPLVRHILALDRAGWRVVEIRPDITGGGAELWHTTVMRRDGDMSMTVTAADPEVALSELLRYAQVDRRPGRAARSARE